MNVEKYSKTTADIRGLIYLAPGSNTTLLYVKKFVRRTRLIEPGLKSPMISLIDGAMDDERGCCNKNASQIELWALRPRRLLGKIHAPFYRYVGGLEGDLVAEQIEHTSNFEMRVTRPSTDTTEDSNITCGTSLC